MIILGVDHGRFCLKEAVIAYLEKNSIPYHDYGCCNGELVDYVLFASKVAYDTAEGRTEKGVLRCDTGIRISIAVNRVKGIRVVVCTSKFCAKATRQHNDTNVLCMGSRVIDGEMAVKLIKIFLETPFDDERCAGRTAQIREIEDGEKL